VLGQYYKLKRSVDLNSTGEIVTILKNKSAADDFNSKTNRYNAMSKRSRASAPNSRTAHQVN
jgi:hypothetical protein